MCYCVKDNKKTHSISKTSLDLSDKDAQGTTMQSQVSLPTCPQNNVFLMTSTAVDTYYVDLEVMESWGNFPTALPRVNSITSTLMW